MTEDSISKSFEELANNLGKLVDEHISLAQAELKREKARLLTDLLFILLAVGAACVGYCVLMMALVLWLRLYMDPALAALVVGLGNLAGAGLFLRKVVAELQKRTSGPMPLLEEALKRDTPVLEHALKTDASGPTVIPPSTVLPARTAAQGSPRATTLNPAARS